MVKNLSESAYEAGYIMPPKSSNKLEEYKPVFPMKYLQGILKKDMFMTFDEIRLYSSYREQAVSAINMVQEYYDTLLEYLQVYYSVYNYLNDGKYLVDFDPVNDDAPIDVQKWMLSVTDAYGYWQTFNDSVGAPKDNTGGSLSLTDVTLTKGDFGIQHSIDHREVSFSYNTKYVIKVLSKEKLETNNYISISRSLHDLKLITLDIKSFMEKV